MLTAIRDRLTAGAPRVADRRKRRPSLEGLEDRLLLWATNGGVWAHPVRITYSFAPDGTNIGGQSSNLYATLNAKFAATDWQAAFQKAAAVWSSYANINMVLVSDSGAAFGAAGGDQQGDPGFGDIRIGMTPQSNGTLAVAFLPPPFNGGALAGDVVFNSNVSWALNADYDLQTVALHEIGHALGMDHSTITSADMYAYYNGIKQSATSDDAAGIQSVYGAYPADAVDDGSFATATNITSKIDSNLQINLGGQSLAGSTDYDFYSVTVPAGTNGKMVVSVQSSGLSSVSPKLVVANSARQALGTVSLPNSFGATATFTVNGVTAGQVFYIRASAASNYGSYGAYGVLVNFGSSAQPPLAPPNTVVLPQPDQGGGSSNMAYGVFGPGHAGLMGNVVAIGGLVGYGDIEEAPAEGRGFPFRRLDPDGYGLAAPGPRLGTPAWRNDPTPVTVDDVSVVATPWLPDESDLTQPVPAPQPSPVDLVDEALVTLAVNEPVALTDPGTPPDSDFLLN